MSAVSTVCQSRSGGIALVGDVVETDEQLLNRFAAHSDATAFEALVRRHGPMVLRVCQRVLLDRHEAEDAFQATFIVLVRKVKAIADPKLLANWLYGVAYRISLRARESKDRRKTHEGQLTPSAPEKAAPGQQAGWDDLRPVLDEELSRLPEKYRVPLVLCYLEGKTTDETADQLGWKRGTVAGRLSRARDLLRNRLTRRGLALTPALLLGLLSTNAASAGTLPSALATGTISAGLATAGGQTSAGGAVSAQALTWADSIAKSMAFAKAKTYATALLIALLLVGGISAYLNWARTPLETGFLNRIYKPGTVLESRYVVFVPQGYRAETAYPIVLFLHGINDKGTDGVKQTRGTLGSYIRKHDKDFPMIAVFPQLPDGDWELDNPGAQRALDILDQVQQDFKIDRKRVYVTGVSLGGFGAWSMAAASPERWAAVAPVGGGCNPKLASKLVKVPIWAFHGEADKLVAPSRDRDMIAAVKSAGGNPRYTEYPGGNHNSASAAFDSPELYQWMLQQRLP